MYYLVLATEHPDSGYDCCPILLTKDKNKAENACKLAVEDFKKRSGYSFWRYDFSIIEIEGMEELKLPSVW